MLDDEAGFPDEAADARRVAEEAEGDVAGRDEERRLRGLVRALGERATAAGGGVGVVHRGGRSAVDRALFSWSAMH